MRGSALRAHCGRAAFGIAPHAAEFQERDEPPVAPDPLLAIEHGRAVLDEDGERRRQHDRQHEHQEEEGDGEIERALHRVDEHALAKAVGEDEPARLQRIEIDFAALALPEGQVIDHVDAGDLAMEQLQDRHAAALVGRDHDLARLRLARGAHQRVFILGAVEIELRAHHDAQIAAGMDEAHGAKRAR